MKSLKVDLSVAQGKMKEYQNVKIKPSFLGGQENTRSQ
jgi:hypothetical protein